MSGNDEIDSSEDRHKISPTFPPDVEPVSLVGIDATQDTLPFIGEPARGADDVPSVIYLNIIPNFKNARDEVRRLQDANSLGAHYFSVKAAESASARMAKGKLPTSQDIDSQIQRDNYRNLVYDAVLVKSPWLGVVGSNSYHREFDVERKEFHSTLLDALLRGLPVSKEIHTKFENVLSSIFDTVQQTKNQRTVLNQWLLGFTYKWDSVQQRVFTSHRSISYDLNQSMQEFVSNKSRVTRVRITMNYRQNDYAFDENIWNAVKDEVSTLITKNPVIREVIEIEDK